MLSTSTDYLRSGGSNINGGNGSRPLGRECVSWTEEMSGYLIDALLHQQVIGNRTAEGRFLTTAFDNVINLVSGKFGVNIDRSHIKNRLKHVKDTFHECESLFGKESGIKWNQGTRRFHADPEVWREFIEKKPEAKRWMTKTINHYDRLLELFGKDRERSPAVVSSKVNPKQKARIEPSKERPPDKKVRVEPPKERSGRQWIPSDGLQLDVVRSSTQPVNAEEVRAEVVAEKNIPRELHLSELCRSENGLVAIPVCANAYGKGLPYAPENWPLDGDEWYWKVGNRSAAGGHWVDRYLIPPSRFRDATGKKTSFTSRLKVEEFIKKDFPDVDPNTFFSKFIWKIPAEESNNQRGTQQIRLHEPESGFPDPAGPCKARNNLCNLEREGFVESSALQDCQICCREPNFCRECCCILCGRVVDNSFGGYSYIKCKEVVKDNYICGHVAHLDCALRCYMTGTVGGTIGLDVQYYCRWCDKKTNLMMHVEKLLETCRSLESRDEIEPILNMGLCILRSSEQAKAKGLENYMGSALAKMKSGVDLAEVWKIENDDGMSILSSGELSPPITGVTLLGAEQKYPYLSDPLAANEAVENLPIFITGDHNVMSAKFENEIDRALLELKRSQESEFRLAEQRLYSQRDYILSLYRQLESDRSELADPKPLSDSSRYNVLVSNITTLVNQAKREEEKLKAMLKVSEGFGKTPAKVVQEHFGLSALSSKFD